MERIALDKSSTAISYKQRAFMVAGYISDYKLTYDEDLIGELGGEKTKTVADFEENKGYVDDNGQVHIFMQNPKKGEILPWFTVVLNDDGKPLLKYNTYKTEEIVKAFNISRIKDLSIANIAKESENVEELHDKEMIDRLLSATSVYVPKVKDSDDFLKKIVKTVIIEKGVDVHRFGGEMEKSYQLTNLITGLNNDSKMNPWAFLLWMELNRCKFKVTVTDTGSDKQTPLKYPITYDSSTGRIIVEKGGDEENEKVARSAKQFS